MKITASLLLLSLTGCLDPGTHGSIESYEYAMPKDSLQMIIDQVIETAPNICKDTAERYIVDITNGKNDTVWDHRDRDGISYETISIETNTDTIEYIIHYYGDETEWNSSDCSSISICYMHDEKGNGGSENDGNLTMWSTKRMLKIFEEEFISQIIGNSERK